MPSDSRTKGLCVLPYLSESQWGVHLNPAIGEIEYKGLRRHLTPNLFRGLSQLMHSETVTNEEFYEALRGLPYEARDSGYVRVNVSLLRQALKGFPLRIETFRGFGYTLRRVKT